LIWLEIDGIMGRNGDFEHGKSALSEKNYLPPVTQTIRCMVLGGHSEKGRRTFRLTVDH